LSYADHIRTASSERPTCWGNARSYDINDPECAGCGNRHSCRAKIDREEENDGGRVYVRSGPSGNTYRRKDPIEADAGVHESGLVGPNEKPIERFAKDAAAGALRGMFYEMWQFWRRFRIR